MTITNLEEFVNGTLADADFVNENFETLRMAINGVISQITNVTNISGNIGHLYELETPIKTSLVAAINYLLALIGDFGSLETNDKTSLISAINELCNVLKSDNITQGWVKLMPDYSRKIGITLNTPIKAAYNGWIVGTALTSAAGYNDYVSIGKTTTMATVARTYQQAGDGRAGSLWTATTIPVSKGYYYQIGGLWETLGFYPCIGEEDN